jgi:hypothetical protein
MFGTTTVCNFKGMNLNKIKAQEKQLKGIVSPDWKGLQMVSLDRFEV